MIGSRRTKVIVAAALVLSSLVIQFSQGDSVHGQPAQIIWGEASGQSEVCAGPQIACPASFELGVSVPATDAGSATLGQFETSLGRKAALMGMYADFSGNLPWQSLNSQIDAGRKPLLTWEPYDRDPSGRAVPLSLTQIASGAYDAKIRRWAADMSLLHGPVFLRFAHEMNGWWYPWGQPKLDPRSIADPANTPAVYVSAYRHIVDVFRSVKVNKVAWMWGPNLVDANPAVNLSSLYPGDDYVDAVGLSGYYTKSTDMFASRYAATLEALNSVAPTKPIFVGETGVISSSSRSAQIVDLYSHLLRTPRVRGVVYFSQFDQGFNYDVTGDSAALSALAQVASLPALSASTGSDGALALLPLVTGTSRIGQPLQATWSWRGTAGRALQRWVSCPSAAANLSTCTQAGAGSTYTPVVADRNRYIRAVLGVMSQTFSDLAASDPAGPILSIPSSPPAPVVDIRGTSVRIALSSPASSPVC